MSYVLRLTSGPFRGFLRTDTGDYSRNRAQARRFDTRADAEAQALPGEKVELVTLSRWNADIEPSGSGFSHSARRH
jgi:hypothetical protein